MPFLLHHGPEHRALVLKIAGNAIVPDDVEDEIDELVTLISDDSLRAKFDETGLTGGLGMYIIDAKAKPFDPDEPRLTFTFPSPELASAFKHWMCGSGEQYFWDAMMDQGHPHMNFDYHDPGGCDVIVTT